MRKKKILFQSDSSLSATGFGRNTKEILSYLHSTGKYDIVEYCCFKPWSRDIEHGRKPWKSFGTLPDNQNEMRMIAPNEGAQRVVAYGNHNLDKIIYQEKPDVYIAVQDIWGIDFAVDRKWFTELTSVLWTTLDSLPIHHSATDIAPKVKNFWVWSNFAEKAMAKLGFSHVKTVHGAIDISKFFRMSDRERATLREKHGIPQDAFIAGFVFRNQPRKSLPQLINGFSKFIKQYPEVKNPRLLLHTHWKEGWRIKDLCKDFQLDEKYIITTYCCKQCKHYSVQNHTGNDIECPVCKNKVSFDTTHIANGISEEQLNEVYNLMDVYVHPFNSGGQELPIQEAKLTELPTLVTTYSCGEESGAPETGSLPLDWAEYFEPESQFIKATTQPYSITKQLAKVFQMSPKERQKYGKIGRDWVVNNFSKEVVGGIIEKLIDDAPFIDHETALCPAVEKPNPIAQIPDEADDKKWIISLYRNVLGKEIDEFDSSVRQWAHQIKMGAKKKDIENYIRREAAVKVEMERKKNLFERIQKDESKKILYVIPASERDVFLSSALFESIKKQYPDYKLYVATNPQYFSIIQGNPFVDEIITYYQEMDNLLFLEGAGPNKGYFDIAFLPHLHTQRLISYTHNGISKLEYETHAHS